MTALTPSPTVNMGGIIDSRTMWVFMSDAGYTQFTIIPLPASSSARSKAIRDQSAPYGVLNRIRDLGLCLISAQRIGWQRQGSRAG